MATDATQRPERVPPDPLDLLTAEQVATLLKIRTKRVYDAVGRGELAAVRIGRYLRFERGAVADAIRRWRRAGDV